MLQALLHNVKIKSSYGNLSVPVTDLQIDSRKVNQGSCFIAIKGVVADGHAYIENAIERGATAVVCEVLPDKRNENIGQTS